MQWIIDGALLIALLALAISTLVTSDTRRACQLFITFAVVLAASWARLQLTGLALAELLISACLTGGLLLYAQRRLPRPNARIDDDA